MVALAGFLAATPALAHHGFGGSYDRSQPIYLEGTVVEAFFGFPHSELVLESDPGVQSASLPAGATEFAEGLVFWSDAIGERVEIEFPPVQSFFALDGRIAAGDKIAIIVLRNCEPPHQLRAQWVAPPDGEPVVREGRMQNEVGGC